MTRAISPILGGAGIISVSSALPVKRLPSIARFNAPPLCLSISIARGDILRSSMTATTTVPERGMRGAAKLIFMKCPDLWFPTRR
jgi:hypothetical protein